MSESIQPIEGITPGALWTTAGVLIGLAGIAIIVFKIIEFYWKAKDRKEQHGQKVGKDMTDVIADKVLEKLAPRFNDIDKKLDADKTRLDNHEAALKSIRSSNTIVRDGLKVSCEALAAVLDYNLHNGNTDQMQKARDDLQNYTNGLIGRVIE